MGFLKNKLNGIKSTISSLNNASFFHIFGSNVYSMFLSFLISIIVVRQLDKTAYGIYSIANNYYSYFALFLGVGLVNGILQYCSEKREDEQKSLIYSFAFNVGTLSNFIIGLAIVATSLIGIDNKAEVNRYLLLMCGIPVFTYIASYYSTYARIKRFNKLFSYANIIGATIYFIVVVIATKLFSVYGYIISSYLQQIITVLFYVVYFKLHKQNDIKIFSKGENKLSKGLKLEILKYSLLCCITNATSTLLSLLDVTCLNRILDDANIIASYKVALAIPNALLFIPTSYMIFVYPYLAERNDKPEELKQYVDKSLKFLLVINALVCAVLFVGAEIIVDILWGKRFTDAVPVFRILIVNYFIAGTFKKLYGNVIAAIKKVKINLYNAALAGLLNIGLNIIFILKFNSIGAAIATFITTVVTSAISYFYYIAWNKKQTS